MSMSDRHPIQRAWRREAEHERVGVDVVGPGCDVVIDVYEYDPPRGDYHLSFRPREWDAVVAAVAKKTRDIQRRLART